MQSCSDHGDADTTQGARQLHTVLYESGGEAVIFQ